MKKIIKNIFATSTSWANEQGGNNVNLVSVFAKTFKFCRLFFI